MSLSAADRLAILDLITRADDAATRRDPDSYVDLFTDDAILDGAEGTFHGRDALRRGVRTVWAGESAGTLHLTLNPYVDDDSDSPGTATAHSTLLLLGIDRPGQTIATAAVTQRVRRDHERWLIARRSVLPLLNEETLHGR
ncbi:MAG: nuclear transport factor 2 family protein [Actinobacteria bacterium]|nr:nuclear transport factor 2 family protein [Actinomycetota bacterium]